MTKFCTWVDINDLITCATFGDDRLRGLGVERGRISHFPIDFRLRPYNTLALLCECVILLPTAITTIPQLCVHEQIFIKCFIMHILTNFQAPLHVIFYVLSLSCISHVLYDCVVAQVLLIQSNGCQNSINMISLSNRISLCISNMQIVLLALLTFPRSTAVATNW